MNCATRHIKLRNAPRPKEIHFKASQTAQHAILPGAMRLNQNQNSLSCTTGATRHGHAPLAQLA
ncbi:hypothetical protein A2U01_0096969, partial [Trifolium medium]|nr:hypothetical protein [Trifolium medium]